MSLLSIFQQGFLVLCHSFLHLVYFGLDHIILENFKSVEYSCGFYGSPNEQNQICELCTFFQDLLLIKPPNFICSIAMQIFSNNMKLLCMHRNNIKTNSIGATWPTDKSYG